jgi:lipid-A-disaccharide synthase-like uncharacterized protein
MSHYLIFGIGFFAQLLFGSRMIIQWIQSEKSGHVVSPPVFWKTSLIASALLLVYGLLRHDAVIILGQLLSYFIYIRNLQLSQEWRKLSLFSRAFFCVLPAFILTICFRAHIFNMDEFLLRNQFHDPLLVIGGFGQLILNIRFVYQWYYAEKIGLAILPLGFWVRSLSGSVLVMIYALYRFDPVLLTGQLFGITVYTRNIMLEARSIKNSKYHGV